MPRHGASALPPAADDSARACSVLGSLAVVGDFWTLAVLRCAAYGTTRFGEFVEVLGVATNVLTDRLSRLVDAGVLARVQYSERPARHEYVLTQSGRELLPVVLALKQWGDAHLQPDGPWTAVRHRGCSSALAVVAHCPDCGAVPATDDQEVVLLRDQ